MQYHVVIHKDQNSDYGVTVPDLPGCFSAGDSLEDAARNAREAIECHIEGMLLDNEVVPMPSTLDTLANNPELADGIWLLVTIDMTRISGQAKRINITIPERVLKQIDSFSHIHGGNRSALLTEAALEYISSHR